MPLVRLLLVINPVKIGRNSNFNNFVIAEASKEFVIIRAVIRCIPLIKLISYKNKWITDLLGFIAKIR